MKILLIGGESGVGKTTIMRKIIPNLGAGKFISYKLFKGTYFPSSRVLLAGIYDGRLFDGSDRLSRICQRDTCEFLSRLNKDLPDILFLAEGDNFFRKDFFEGVQRAGFDSYHVFLTLNETSRENRHAERLSFQTQKTLNSRITKYSRLMMELNRRLILNSNTEDDLNFNQHILRQIITSHCQNWTECDSSNHPTIELVHSSTA